MLDAEAFSATLQVTRLLDEMQVPYVIGGSVASTVHGFVRTTVDVDIVADLTPEHVGPFSAGLSEQFYLDEETMHRAIFCGEKPRQLSSGRHRTNTSFLKIGSACGTISPLKDGTSEHLE